MENARPPALSPRAESLREKLKEPGYRHGYVAAHLRRFLAKQMRALRGERTQKEFSEFLDETQSVISDWENPTRGPGTISTLLKIAKKNDVAVVVRFVDFDAFVDMTDDQSDRALAPQPYGDARAEVSAPPKTTVVQLDQARQVLELNLSNANKTAGSPSEEQVLDWGAMQRSLVGT